MNSSTIIFGWLLSIAALIATIVIVVRIVRTRNKTESPLSSWVAYTVGMFVVVFIFILSQELTGLAGAEGSPILLDSLFNSLQMFGMNRDIELDTSALSFLGGLLPLYLIYNAALHLAAPVGTIGTILSLLGQLFITFRLKSLARSNDVFAFSALNPQSLALAKSTQDAYEQAGDECLVVFTDVEEEAALSGDAKADGMMCLPQSADYVAKAIDNSNTKHTFVFSDTENEVSNLSAGVELAHKLADAQNASGQIPQVLMFSNSLVGGPVVDAAASAINSLDKENPIQRVELKRVDRVRSTVNTLLDTYPLFTTGLQNDCLMGDEFITQLAYDGEVAARRILIVGESAFAKEFLKGALWAAQMGSEIDVSIDVVSPQANDLASHFAFDAPEFAASDTRPYHDFYNLTFTSLDPESGEYLDYLRNEEAQQGSFTYVLVAMDDDLLSAKIARRTREILEQVRLHKGMQSPAAFIAAVIHDGELAQTMLSMKARKRLYAIQPVGDSHSIYSYHNIFAPVLYRSARNLNRMYTCSWDRPSGEKLARMLREADMSFANSEYDQRSSVASALHRKYSLYLFCRKMKPELLDKIDWSKPLTLSVQGSDTYSRNLSELINAYEAYFASGQATWLSEIEHDRWSAYVSSEGFECVRLEDLESIYEAEGRHEFRLGLLHPCLVRFDALPALDEAAKEHRETEPPFQRIDDIVLQNTRLIIAADEDSFLTEWNKQFGAKETS